MARSTSPDPYAWLDPLNASKLYERVWNPNKGVFGEKTNGLAFYRPVKVKILLNPKKNEGAKTINPAEVYRGSLPLILILFFLIIISLNLF